MKLFGEPVHVAAHICQMPGISGHADVNGLLDWAKAFEEKPQKVFVTHGDDTVTEIFAKRLTDELGYDTMAPFSGTVYDLADDVCLYEAKGENPESICITEGNKSSQSFRETSGTGLQAYYGYQENEGTPNKDLERFSRDVQSLCDKWDRTDIN